MIKRSKTITQQPKAIENPSISDIKLVIIEHRKASYKLSKSIRQAEKLSQVGSGKISNTPYASSYHVQILDCFNLELQLKDTESAIKTKLIYLLTDLKSFKFVTPIVLEF